MGYTSNNIDTPSLKCPYNDEDLDIKSAVPTQATPTISGAVWKASEAAS